jgi:hypothetical protein
VYFYAATDGGAAPVSPRSFTQDLGVLDGQGVQSVIIGHSSGDVGVFDSAGALYPSIGGVGVTGSSSYQKASLFQDSSQNSLSGSFTLSSTALVVLVSAASNDTSPMSVSSPFTLDAGSTNTQGGGMMFAHASLSPGTYSFTVNYNPVSDPASTAIGVVLYAFGSSISAVTPPPPLGGLFSWTIGPLSAVDLVGGVISGILAALILLRVRRVHRRGSLRERFRAFSSKKISVRSFALAGALSFLIIQLNIYFAWTSHVGAGARGPFSGGGGPLRSFLVSEVNDFVRIQLGIPGLSSFFTNLASRSAPNGGGGPVLGEAPLGAPLPVIVGGGGGFPGGGFGGGGFPFFGSPISLAMKYLIDTEVILFTVAVFVISLFLFQKSGIGVALLRAFEITSLTILPLGLEIFFFDRPAFNIHASDIQVLAGTAWFTNADVLFLTSAILGIALSVEVMRYAKVRGSWLVDKMGVRHV